MLGLYLSERIEERKNEKEAEKLLSKIKSELSQNRKQLDEWVPYHREVVKTLDSLAKDDQFIDDFIADRKAIYPAFTRETLMGETPTSDAWDIAKSHPLIVNFDYDELLVLSKIYNQQNLTFEGVPKLIELLLDADFNAKGHARQNVELFRDRLHELASREVQLLSFYQQAEKILN